MSLDRIDARFLLPRSPATALVLGDLPRWRTALLQADVAIVSHGKRADLVVASSAHAAEATRAPAEMAIVEGARLRRGGTTFLALPRPDLARLMIPLGEPRAARYALRRFASPTEPAKRLRNRFAAAAVGHGLAPNRLVIWVRGHPAPPFVLRAARDIGGWREDASWFLAAGQGDVFSRGAFAVFPPGHESPTHVVKFARVAGYAAPFDRDERGLNLVRRAGPTVAAHAPTLLGRFAVAGIECSIESAAVGERLFAVLRRPTGRRGGEELVGSIAAWLIDVQATTASSPAKLGAERRRAEELVSAWNVARDDIRLPGDVRPVLQHNDPGSWNVVVDGRDFTLMDWEDAEEHGFPLVDLWYFLADGIAHLDGIEPSGRADHFVRLFRGELRSSRLLFEWTRRAVERLGVPPEAVGSLATLGWLRHGSADRARRQAAAAVDGSQQPPIDFGELTERWLSEPGLGPGWNSWAHRA